MQYGVGVMNWRVDTFGVRLQLQNNLPVPIKIDSVSVEGGPVSVNKRLDPGERISVTLTTAYSLNPENYEYDLAITYTNLRTDIQDTINKTEILEGTSLDSSTTQSDTEYASLVAFWRLDSSFEDASANQNNFTCSTCPSVNSSRSTYQFTGTQFANATKDFSLGDFSIGHWIFVNDSSLEMYTIGNTQGNDGYKFGINASSVAFSVGNSGYFFRDTCSSKELTDNAWHHIGAVFTSGSTVKCYVDGELVKIKNISSFSGMQSNKPSLSLGGNCCTAINGSVDDIYIFNRSLSATQMRRLYQNGR
ncbi:MAG: hypothetical protein ACI8Y7_000989 [Candidatus Woesearchaeota archaeon]|jgi:hypothetical protein